MMSMFTGSLTPPMTGDITIGIGIGTRMPALAPCKAEWPVPVSARQSGVS